MQKQGYKLWTSESAKKVLRDKQYSASQLRSADIKLFRNSQEGFRLLLTAERDIKALSVCVSTPICGKKALLGEVQVGMALYYPLKKPSAGTNSETGDYPDALLPISVAQEYGLNKVEKGHNAEFLIDVHADKDAVAGIYNSIVTVDADGEVQQFSFEITVWDFVLPDKNHTKQFFILDNEQLLNIEKRDLYGQYYEDLLAYRINCSQLPAKSGGAASDTEQFLQAVRDWFDDERVSVYEIPTRYTSDYTEIDFEATTQILKKLADICFEDKKNYFSKAVVYIWICDEPHLSPERTQKCRTELPRYEEIKCSVSKAVSERGGAFAKKVAQSVMNMPNLITSSVYSPILPKNSKQYNITWCPAFTSQHEHIKMWHALNKGEKWWYGCDWPTPPYPTYHIDDSVTSPRLLSWMQYRYHVTGNLYWRINFWNKKTDGKYIVTDPYTVSAYTQTNGEGNLIYPGSRFKLNTFVPSLRLYAIRDGINDFEALYMLESLLKRNAKKRGVASVDFNSVFSPVFTRLFDKTMNLDKPVISIEKAKESLAAMLIAADKFGLCICSRRDGQMTFYVDGEICADGGELERNGELYTLLGDEVCLMLRNGNKELQVPLYLKDIVYPEKYALSDCWNDTAKKYGIAADPETVLRPYYEILDFGNEEAQYACCAELHRLIEFVWKTETAIEKRVLKDSTELIICVPKGDIKFDDEAQIKESDDGAKLCRIETKNQRVRFSVKNEKGNYSVNLYI